MEYCNNFIFGIGYEFVSNNFRVVDMIEICKENYKIVIKFIVCWCLVYVGMNLRFKFYFWMFYYNICNDVRMWLWINFLIFFVL